MGDMKELGEFTAASGEVDWLPDLQKTRLKGLVRRGDHWWHLSAQNPTVKLRPVTDNKVDEEQTRVFRLDDANQKRELEELLANTAFFRGWSIDEAIDGRDEIMAGAAAREERQVDGARSSPVPVTRLRQFYRVLRNFGDRDVALSMLKASLRSSGRQLTEVFAASYAHLLHYNNEDDDFGDNDSHRLSAPTHEGFAASIVRELISVGRWAPSPDLKCEYVSRELSPLRTTNAVFDDHRPARSSGAGGIDVLLRSADGLPIVGELKASTDTNLFVALVQALTYACELATPAQRRRLVSKRGFPAQLASSDGGPHVDLYLMYERDTDDEIRKGTMQLAEMLLARPDGIRRWVRRIAFLEFSSAQLSGCTISTSPDRKTSMQAGDVLITRLHAATDEELAAIARALGEQEAVGKLPSKNEKVSLLSRKLRADAGSSFANVFRDDHELPYARVLEDVFAKAADAAGWKPPPLSGDLKTASEEMCVRMEDYIVRAFAFAATKDRSTAEDSKRADETARTQFGAPKATTAAGAGSRSAIATAATVASKVLLKTNPMLLGAGVAGAVAWIASPAMRRVTPAVLCLIHVRYRLEAEAELRGEP